MIADVTAGRIRAYLAGSALNVVAVEDVAAGHLLALERGRSGVRYQLGGDNLALAEVFAIVARRAGRPPPRVGVPYAVAHGAAWAADRTARLRRNGHEPRLLNLDEVRVARLPMTFSSARAERDLGYTHRPAAEALEAAADWALGVQPGSNELRASRGTSPRSARRAPS
jgi:dihydroflavonol-4-reductase